MTEENLQQLWKSYQDAWADIPADERELLLRASVAEEVVFTSPNANGRGFSDLVMHIADFQRQFPGAYFRSNRLIEQNDQLLSEWTMFNRDGTAFLTAHSYAQFNAAGRLTHLAGFWKL
ncbi:MAG: nuclear transport factor 2 family protein [Janthinobacterium lividum]